MRVMNVLFIVVCKLHTIQRTELDIENNSTFKLDPKHFFSHVFIPTVCYPMALIAL